MSFITIQFIMFISIIISGLIGGKKGTILSTLVWGVATLITKRSIYFGNIQFITLAMSFQISLVMGIAKDFIQCKVKNFRNKEKKV